MRFSELKKLVARGGGNLDYDNVVEHDAPGRYTPADPAKSAVVRVTGTPAGPGNSISIQLVKTDDSSTFTGAVSTAPGLVIISVEVPPGWDYEVFAQGTAEVANIFEATRK